MTAPASEKVALQQPPQEIAKPSSAGDGALACGKVAAETWKPRNAQDLPTFAGAHDFARPPCEVPAQPGLSAAKVTLEHLVFFGNQTGGVSKAAGDAATDKMARSLNGEQVDWAHKTEKRGAA